MKEAVTDGRIVVKGPLAFQRIESLQVETDYGEHTRMQISGYLAEEEPWGFALMLMEGQEIQITTLDENGREAAVPVFGGVIEKLFIEVENGSTKAVVYGVSATWLLDQEERNRSFQNVSMTYYDVVCQVLKDYSDAAVIFCADKKKIGQPLYQYRETDWEFLKRIAGYCGCYLFPGDISGETKFYFGLRSGTDAGNYTTDIYESKFDRRFYDFYGYAEQKLPERKGFVYHEVERFDGGEIGDRVKFGAQELLICKKSCRLDKGLLKFLFVLGEKTLVTAPKRYHKKLSGVSLQGTVLDTKAEEVKIHLLMDEQQDPGTAYWYPWVPETGNLMYCMPEIGTRVVLYFGNEEENSAKCIRCVRTQEAGEIQDPTRRLFTTQDQKRLALEPQSMALQAQNVSDLQMQLADEQGISLNSHKKVSVLAGGNINIKGSKVNITAPQEVSLVKLGAGALNMSNRFDAIGVKSKVSTSAVGTNFPSIQVSKKSASVQQELTANAAAIVQVQPVNTGDTQLKQSIISTELKRINFTTMDQASQPQAAYMTSAFMSQDGQGSGVSYYVNGGEPAAFLSNGGGNAASTKVPNVEASSNTPAAFRAQPAETGNAVLKTGVVSSDTKSINVTTMEPEKQASEPRGIKLQVEEESNIKTQLGAGKENVLNDLKKGNTPAALVKD